jgi:hypothetical protein
MAWFSLDAEEREPGHPRRDAGGEGGSVEEGPEDGPDWNDLSPRLSSDRHLDPGHGLEAANPFGPKLDPEAMKRPATLRRSIAEAVRLLSKPGIDGD